MMVWRIWAGQELRAQPQLLAPSDGGERSTAAAVKEKKVKVHPSKKEMRTLHSSLPSFVMETAVRATPDSDPVTRTYKPGAGWNGGAGSGMLKGSGGDGWGPGWGAGFAAVFGGVSATRPPKRSRQPVSVPGKMVIVLDVSGSMRKHDGTGGDPAALWDFVACVRALHAASSFNVVCFSNTAAKFRTECVPVTAENVHAAVAWAHERFRAPQCGEAMPVPGGSSGTSRFDMAMSAALGEDPQKIFVISDGQPVVREGGHSLPEAAILAKISRSLTSCNTRPEMQTINTAMTDRRSDRGGFLQRLEEQFRKRQRSVTAD